MSLTGKDNPYMKNLDHISDIMKTAIKGFGDKDKKIAERLFMQDCTDFIPAKFKEKAKAKSLLKDIDGKNILIIATKSSAISQELQFVKKELFDKIQSAGEKAYFEIKDIIFSTKSWE